MPVIPVRRCLSCSATDDGCERMQTYAGHPCCSSCDHGDEHDSAPALVGAVAPAGDPTPQPPGALGAGGGGPDGFRTRPGATSATLGVYGAQFSNPSRKREIGEER